VRCKPDGHHALELLPMRTMLSKVRPVHVALFIASVLYLIAGTARSAEPPTFVDVLTPELSEPASPHQGW
jgi:hypothetical protein